ncbi:hypothetical protein [uncultured Faecalicoccus sp.]|uniref:hypothetical protein n=1 Tax=uncultured Faecalicoccus sp. TaxID=1971760 RepID=UPI002586BB62|nr:hypothetical protein [uncultured Faecalicoccus sp.]
MKEDAEQVLTRKMRRILLISLLFTGGCSVSCLVEIVQDTLQGVWSYVGWAQYLYTMVFCSVIILFFFTILLLCWTHRSFADIFSKGTHLIGVVLITAALVIPRIPDYRPGMITIWHFGNFVLADGLFLLIGIVFILLASILEVGYSLQNEVDATI